MLSVNLLLLLFITYAAHLIICDRCCEINNHELPRYELIKNNSRSKQHIISRRAVSNVSECIEFAASKKALAFNFAPTKNHSVSQENICQVLECPEDHNMTTLERARSYKYYSMYPVFVPAENTTLECIPKVGMFLFSSEELNYTQANNFCQEQNASLAHIISEERTDGLAKFVSPKLPSFVGLSNNDKEKIWKNVFGEPLSCFDYRAWGERQPSSSKGCAALVNPSDKDSPGFWIVAPCRVSLPFICEIYPLFKPQQSSQHHKNRTRT